MSDLTDMPLATDEELSRYESELVTMATDYAITLDNCRELARQRLRLEAVKDGIDETQVVDDGSAKAIAMRDWATRLALAFFWEDVASGRDSAASAGKAQLAARNADRAGALFKDVGWPMSGGVLTVVKDVDVLPRLIKFRV